MYFLIVIGICPINLRKWYNIDNAKKGRNVNKSKRQKQQE